VSDPAGREAPSADTQLAVGTIRGALADSGYTWWVATISWLVKRGAIALASAIVLVVACANDPESPGQPTSAGPETIATNLGVPWGIAFLPDGSALIAERDSGAIQHMVQPGVVNNVGAVAGVAARGEGGLLGLATSGQTVFAYLTTGQDNRVVTMRFDGATLTEQSAILTGIPAGSIHDGGRIAFGPDGKLYVTTGESGNRELAQDRMSLGGKILRINPDGSIPPDNPDPASPVWSFGHRNIQGLAWDSAGRLWVTEYGANRLDEINLIQRGGNYGWPMAEGRADTPGLIDPVIQWPVNEASPSGLAYFGGSLWVACLRGQRLYRIPVGADGSLADPAPLFVGQYGRLRTVVAAPDGALWFTTSNRDGRGSPRDGDDRILQFRP
jgi:glucose/arabinose dehydrogenase